MMTNKIENMSLFVLGREIPKDVATIESITPRDDWSGLHKNVKDVLERNPEKHGFGYVTLMSIGDEEREIFQLHLFPKGHSPSHAVAFDKLDGVKAEEKSAKTQFFSLDELHLAFIEVMDGFQVLVPQSNFLDQVVPEKLALARNFHLFTVGHHAQWKLDASGNIKLGDVAFDFFNPYDPNAVHDESSGNLADGEEFECPGDASKRQKALQKFAERFNEDFIQEEETDFKGSQEEKLQLQKEFISTFVQQNGHSSGIQYILANADAFEAFLEKNGDNDDTISHDLQVNFFMVEAVKNAIEKSIKEREAHIGQAMAFFSNDSLQTIMSVETFRVLPHVHAGLSNVDGLGGQLGYYPKCNDKVRIISQEEFNGEGSDLEMDLLGESNKENSPTGPPSLAVEVAATAAMGALSVAGKHERELMEVDDELENRPAKRRKVEL